jgi:hypothetical protein
MTSETRPSKDGYGTRTMTRDKSGFSKSLGHWLLNRAGRYAHGWKVQRVVGNKARKLWRVVPPS